MVATVATRDRLYAQKKSECFFAGEVIEGSMMYDIDAETGSFILANLPPNAIITDAYVHVETASDAATSAVATLGTAEDGTQILSAADLTTTGKQGTFTGQSLTGTGQQLFLGLTYTGAATEVGHYIVVVEYLEYQKRTGEYTRVD